MRLKLLLSAAELVLSVAAATSAEESSGFPTPDWPGWHGHEEFKPQGLNVGSELSLKTRHFSSFQLDSRSPIATVDFGTERAGYPFFVVSHVNEPVQIEVKYAEQFNALNQSYSDGPYPWALSLTNCFRVETFNITRPGRVESSLIQGGQRWLSFKVLNPGRVTIEQVGLVATVDTREVRQLPGQFSCDDDELNDIWDLGARAALTACVDKGSQGPIWEVDPEEGVFVRSIRPSHSLSTAEHATYTLEFDAKIVRGGIWWSVAFPLYASSGLHLMLVSEQPNSTTFLNTDPLLKPNTIMLASGYAFVQQTSLPSTILGTFDVPFAVKEGEWHRIKTALINTGNLSVSLDGTEVFNEALPGVGLYGAFGFGAWQDQEAYVRDVSMWDTAAGTVFYNNSMTGADVLADYGAQPNLAPVCLDGPKRDRLVWLGDFYHTSRIIGASTSRFDLSKGTLQFVLDTEIASGDVNAAPVMSYDPAVQGPFESPSGPLGQPDYQIMGAMAFYEYVRQTNDLDWVRSTWPKWKLHADYLVSEINSTDNLIYLASGFIGPAAGSSAESCAFVQAARGMSEVAEAIGDAAAAKRYASAADQVAGGINTHLWNDELGAYAWDISDPNSISTAGTGLCITSGVASANQTLRSLAAVEALKNAIGYMDQTGASSTDNLSPFMNGFLLPAFFMGDSETHKTGLSLIKGLWGAMRADPHTTSGGSWEYVTPGGQPGLDWFTSLAHPWGGAATYVLTEYVAGLRAQEGVAGFGYREWVVAPQIGMDLGLKTASADVVTPHGPLSVRWEVRHGELEVYVKAPHGTTGTLLLGDRRQRFEGKEEYRMSLHL